MGSGHMASLERALALVDAAAAVGADAVKFQMYRVDRFIVPRQGAEALRGLELPVHWLPLLAERATSDRIDFLCTAFDIDSLEAVDPWVPRHKIGSYEAAAPGFTEAVLAKGKPTMISHGRLNGWLSYGSAFGAAAGGIPLVCRSEYPSEIAGYLHDVPIGFAMWGVSDHTLHPTIVPCAAVARGAGVVEKHMRWWRDTESPDAGHSIEPDAFGELVAAVRLTERACA